MVSNMYRNMLIVERNITNKSIELLIKNQYKIWFELGIGSKAFRHESPLDKVIIFYDQLLENQNKITKIDDTCDWSTKFNPVGYMKIFSRGTEILVIEVKFPSSGAKEGLNSFWYYLVECIRLLGTIDIDNLKFTVYWRKIAIETLIKDIQERGLLTNQAELSHTFKAIEIRTNTPVVVSYTPVTFGTSVFSR
jgi:hypothetical protein